LINFVDQSSPTRLALRQPAAEQQLNLDRQRIAKDFEVQQIDKNAKNISVNAQRSSE